MLGWGLLSFSEKETGVVLLSPFLSFLSFHSSFSLYPYILYSIIKVLMGKHILTPFFRWRDYKN